MSDRKRPKASKRSPGKKHSTKPRSAKTTSKIHVPSPRGGTKQEAVLALLGQARGATIAGIMKATHWQEHSVRGFFAGVVRRKLRLTLTSVKRDGERVHRIAA